VIDPAPIYEAATAFWKSAVLFAACRLGVFDALEQSAGAVALAQRLDLSERGTASRSSLRATCWAGTRS